MRDVSRKPTTLRTAKATTSVSMSPATAELVRSGGGPKGDPLPVARVAGVMAAKDTGRIIPYCHPIRVDHVGIDFTVRADCVEIACTVTAVDRTGVEMEALCGAMVAALTIYDMLKPIDPDLVIGEARLTEKRGGKSDFAVADAGQVRGAVPHVSDSTAAGRREDTSGAAIAARMAEAGVQVEAVTVLPDDPDAVEAALRRLVSEGVQMVFTTGGTGLGPRDRTVEAARRVIGREAPGITEAMRMHGFARTPRAALSRGVAGMADDTLIVTLPGSTKGAQESLDALWPALLHVFPMARGGGH
jgi:molybdenum cofactor biosynthesis protein MoaC